MRGKRVSIDPQGFREDSRRVGIALTVAGLIAVFLEPEHVSFASALYAILSGVFLILLGLVNVQNNEE
ncbi:MULTISPECIES: hypothetical protein [Thioalkalivibrio]|uniref:Uncharacterized protein n=1 Tax=Thioalkalivibrio halophilus TaxID=252474 RepID=A0A1V2ZY78_9GAMM|nr:MULTISPECIES: hypothetical protein [Thioalkalivibrio]OOC10074.1 hypothetical protein B1A74_07795 [Thioalkalivibrio halophilus]